MTWNDEDVTNNTNGELIKCKDCGKGFLLSPEKKQFFLDRGLHLPKRCPTCRKARKQEREEPDIFKDIKRMPR